MRLLLTIVWLSLLTASSASAQDTYVNPVIPGDHPDPTLTRVGNHYYASGSSFNVTPKIYHSTDLVHWEAISQPVEADWELYGDAPAAGIWGGHTVYKSGLYWHFFGRGSGDRAMYYVTASSPEGPWSDPIRMRVPEGVPGLGVDNSIFIDEDLFRPDRWFLLAKNGESGNWIIELGDNGQPSGEVYDLTWLNPENEDGTYPYGWAEGPVMWEHEGYYYYSFAQHLVGTQYVMRSEVLSDDPDDWDEPRVLFESSGGAADFGRPNHNTPAVTTANGTSWMMSHSYDVSEWQALGRQGLLHRVVYEDGWPVAEFPTNGAHDAPDLPSSGIPWMVPRSDMFDAASLPPDWSFLGFTPDDSYSLTERAGWLRLEPSGGLSFPVTPGQNTVIQNAAEHAYSLVTRVDFAPAAEADEAGLWTFNGPETLQAKLFVTAAADGGRAVTFSYDGTVYTRALSEAGPVWLRLQREGHVLTGSYSTDGLDWTAVGEDINVASMDREQPSEESGYDFNAFTGNQQGPYVRGGTAAYFDFYVYRDAYSPISARYPTNYNGVVGSGLTSGYLNGIGDGDWAMYAGVEFGSEPDGGDDVDYPRAPQTLEVVASSASEGGTIEVLLDSLDGRQIAEVEITNTGDLSTYQTFTAADLPEVTGQHDVFLRFSGAADTQLFRIQSFSFTPRVTQVAVDDAEESVGYALRQNHPNPFARATLIEYVLPQAGAVSLEVYDAMGRRVATLVDDVKAAGTHGVRFDSEGLASGVYFYQLTGPDYSAVKRMVLAR